jgi:hypothetical protein|tara:strand:+ start:4041 stop:4994 length:954 start_codon:yes stop_codon:yes gene_type:complete
MKVHTLDIDSGERNPELYPNPADYTVFLNTPIYEVTKISMISARIHHSQFLIHARNKIFQVRNISASTDYTLTLTEGNYGGKELATELVAASTAVAGPITGATFDKDKNSITITGSTDFELKFKTGTNGYDSTISGYTTPHDIFGLPANDISSTSSSLTTGSINLQGPDAIIVKLSSGSDEFNKTIYSESPFYTGRILMCGDVINYSGVDDAVEHNFDSGAQKTIQNLHVKFYYSSNNRLIPYDFRNANHILKLAVTCSTDKFENIPKLRRDDSLPPPMSIPEYEDPHRWDSFLSIFLVVATGLFLLLVMKKPKIIE